MAALLEDVHEGLDLPPQASRAACVKGKYAYYHYGCDGVDDRGWGCGYRTLQTICSWVVFQKQEAGETARAVPSIAEIQAALVLLGDKEARFEGSRDWIGSTEVFLSLDHFYQVPCRILHARTGDQVANHMDALFKHFEQQGSPVMMGGDSDASSKGILGVCQTSSGESHLLVLDPHWYRNDAKHGPLVGAKAHVQQNGWIAWRSLDSLMESSFYNLCLPLLHSIAKSRS
uniref:Putative peptidase family c78 n=1 Tax=Hyalomma excavatum TaxID=257692 RepID=A0A131XDB1_9ACAR